MIFAFQVLPTIIFIAALFAILYYYGVMQFVVRLFAVAMHRVMKCSGAESLNVAASIFMGQTEAPLTIRPYLPEMTQSELMTVMTSGMAHISGGIMAAYILFGIEAKHLLTAVIMTAPGTIMMAKMLVPETDVPKTMGTVRLEVEQTDVQRDRRRGPRHRRRIAARDERGRDAHFVLALIAMVNYILGYVHLSPCSRSSGSSSRRLRGAWACPGATRRSSAICLGTRMVLNEFVAYAELGRLKLARGARPEVSDDRDICALRVRQLQLNRNPDWRYRRARAQPSSRPGAARASCDVRGDARKLHDRDDRRLSSLSANKKLFE